MRRPAFAAALVLGACVPAQGPLMRPGEDCMRCHGGDTVPGAAADAGFAAHHARPWTIAGTVYDALDADPNAGVLGAYVHITDSSGWSFELRSNLAGNFYSAERVAFPPPGRALSGVVPVSLIPGRRPSPMGRTHPDRVWSVWSLYPW